MPTPDHTSPPQWNLLAAVCAWLLPGLGHWLLGERRRALILAAAIATLWIAGLLVGGLSVVDRRQNWMAFAGQACLAPSFAADSLTQYLKSLPPASLPPQDSSAFQDDRAELQPALEPSFGRVNEHGVLYTAIAGLLNLLAVVDVAHRGRPTPPAPRQP